LIALIASIIVFGVLISVHELGHFLMAKAVGMRVDEFAIGFGPRLYQTQDKETKYSLRLIPMGGYNRIAGMEPGEEDTPNGFGSKPLWARMLVILAGVGMNFLLSFVIYFGIFFVSGMDIPINQPVLGNVVAGQPAALAGLVEGDEILSIDGKKLTQWYDIRDILQETQEKKVTVVIRRGDKELEKSILPKYVPEVKRYMIGVSPKFEKKQMGFVESLKYAGTAEKRITLGMLDGLRMIVTGKASAELAGPIGVAQMAGSVAKEGMEPLLSFIAFLSLNLAILNLIPIPALDGGQFLILVAEGIAGRRLNPKVKMAIQGVGVALILALTVFATVNDILR
jgi:regulator of sigma E protease